MTQAFVLAGVLNRAQLATELGITEETIVAYETDGMPCISVGRKIRLYDVQEILKWMKRKRNKKAA